MSAGHYVQLALRRWAIVLASVAWILGAGEASALSCAQDLDGSGAIDRAFETATCQTTPDGALCPLSVADCQPTETCPLDANATCTSGQCSVTHSCTATNTGYVCPVSGKSYPDSASCTASCQQTAACTTEQVCPIDANLACMDTGGGQYQCSPNQCADLSEGAIAGNPDVTTTTVDTSMPDNSGPRAADGTCLGALSIFSGRGMDCKKSGLRSHFHDCCDDGTGLVPDSTGAELGTLVGQQAVSTVATFGIKAIASVGRQLHYNYIMWQADAGTHMLSASKITSNAITSASESVLTMSTLYFAAASIIVQYFLIPNCSQMDLETATLAESKMCHYVGTYCSEKWKFIGCVQKKASYCCFNSMLGRIIHEQGRPQLKSFTSATGGMWGSPGAPNCRGFSPSEFQQLDFSAMDLSEYYGHITKVATDTINSGVPQGTMTNAVQEFYNNIQ